jgi:hypothetical protein
MYVYTHSSDSVMNSEKDKYYIVLSTTYFQIRRQMRKAIIIVNSIRYHKRNEQLVHIGIKMGT